MTHAGIKARAIPSLDGLRAVAVFAVMLGHSHSAFLDSIPFNHSFRNGDQGVAIFFVISGFLITHLLLREQNKTGTISLRRFYLRRTLRIFPPFYVYILVVVLLGLLHRVQINGADVLAASTYSWNYDFFPGSYILGHCWSLSLEEQFYLLWPFCMVYLNKSKAIKISLAIILLSPGIRVAMYFLVPESRTHMNMMLHTHLDTIMTGCLLALLIDVGYGEKLRLRLMHWAAPLMSILFLLFVDSPADIRWRGMYQATIGISLENAAIASLLVFVVFRHESLLGRFLNMRWICHLGMISYSLYLWQQLFTGPYTHAFPLGLVWTFICAEASYFLIEKPSFRIRDRVQQQPLFRTQSI